MEYLFHQIGNNKHIRLCLDRLNDMQHITDNYSMMFDRFIKLSSELQEFKRLLVSDNEINIQMKMLQSLIELMRSSCIC